MTKLVFNTWTGVAVYQLYSVVCYSGEAETCRIMANDWSKFHHTSEVVTLKPAERIVAARVDVNKPRNHPTNLAFFIYEET